MLTRDLYQLLSDPGNGAALREAIAEAMPAYRLGLAEEGRSCSVAVESDGSLLVIAASHLVVLCEAFLDEQIDAVELDYLATALELAPDFQFISEDVEDITSFLSSQEANGPVTTEVVTKILRILRERMS
jgi:hypothetical protein